MQIGDLRELSPIWVIDTGEQSVILLGDERTSKWLLCLGGCVPLEVAPRLSAGGTFGVTS